MYTSVCLRSCTCICHSHWASLSCWVLPLLWSLLHIFFVNLSFSTHVYSIFLFFFFWRKARLEAFSLVFLLHWSNLLSQTKQITRPADYETIAYKQDAVHALTFCLPERCRGRWHQCAYVWSKELARIRSRYVSPWSTSLPSIQSQYAHSKHACFAVKSGLRMSWPSTIVCG